MHSGSRAVIVGHNRGGKSVRAMTLANPARALWVVDPKHSVEVPRAPVIYKPQDLLKHPRAVFRPRLPCGPKSADLEEVFRLAFGRGGILLLLDEAALITSSYAAPPSLLACVQAGAVRGIGVWAVTQRPVGVHPMLFSEADWFAVFYLQAVQDRKRVEDMIGPMPTPWAQLPKYHYVFWQKGEGDPRLMLPVPLAQAKRFGGM